ncbi:MAG: type IV pilin-like G/H family protein [Rivularia sp. (in: cyanobacteria)]
MLFIEIFRTFPSARNIFSKTTSLPTKLSTIGLFLLLASISGCDSSINAQSPQQKWTGEWKFKHPYSDSSSQKVRFILTPEGKAYFIIPDSSTNEKVAYEIPLEKVSNRASLPANIKVVTVEEQVKEAEKRREETRISESEAIISSMNRLQQVNFLEKSKFTNSFEELKLGIKSEKANYGFRKK